MGCTLLKTEFRHISANLDVPVNQQMLKSEEAEVLVVHHGKGESRTQLDEFTDTNLNLSPAFKTNQRDLPSTELQSKTLEINLMHPVKSLQSKTEKIEFEIHPHSFDFSFIEAKPEPVVDDLEKFYQEIQEMN
jgi:hypothetical protein